MDYYNCFSFDWTGNFKNKVKEFINEKHSGDVFNEKIPGDPRVSLREHVEDTREHTMNKIKQKVVHAEEE